MDTNTDTVINTEIDTVKEIHIQRQIQLHRYIYIYTVTDTEADTGTVIDTGKDAYIVT